MNQLVLERTTDVMLATQTQEKGDQGTRWMGGTCVSLPSMLANISNRSDIKIETVNESYSSFKSPLVEKIENAVLDVPHVKNDEGIANDKFLALHEWEGIVLELQEDTFTARLTDVTDRQQQPEEGDFLIEDIRSDDLKLLREGAVFRWVVGYEIKKRGEKRRSSQIIFRRLPQWTKREIEEADREAMLVMESINWE